MTPTFPRVQQTSAVHDQLADAEKRFPLEAYEWWRHASNLVMARGIQSTVEQSKELRQNAEKLHATAEKLQMKVEQSHQDAHNARLRAKESREKAVWGRKRAAR